MIVYSYITTDEYRDMSKLVDQSSAMAKFLGAVTEQTAFSRLEKAVLQLASSSYSILFSIRELVNQGYFPSVEILLRSLLDRVTTIAWLRLNQQEGLDIWERGWILGERPKPFSKKLEFLKDYKFFLDETRSFSDVVSDDHLDSLHGAVHGDTQSVNSNFTYIFGEHKLIAGPNTFDTEQCKRYCKIIGMFNAQLIKEVEETVPRLCQFELQK